MSFGRVLTAMITPFDGEGNVHYAEAEKLADYLAAHGSDTLVVCGTTGESPTLSWEEEYELFDVVRRAVAGRAKVVAGTGSNATREAVVATRKAAALGLDGTLQVCPYYNKPTQDGLFEHFRAVAQAGDLPVILYNVPGRTGVHLAPETVARLAEVPGIVAIKEASGSLDQVSAVRALTCEDFVIYCGDDSLTLPMLAVGATGVVSIASHLVGEPIQQMIRAFENGHNDKARRIHLHLLPLFRGLFWETNPIPVKLALALQGWDVNHLRLPLVAGSEELGSRLEKLLHQLELLV
ncbi:4-hydroxy-tetrahydrodipicolinate synthase [Gloeobacter violaceus]|uniref:4-hydroxy-tetrahydrodipicolinate synthase n=1 Tax=Gloeobacter violaceus (strain ATCC 29082 / PCC 7421) TaxID=251221 RepID=Q7NLV1_GLOVI|nr:4-hydroxy-tetrahydrodipicolinate synthase [Gloeobacter violaceus]BAC88959.1 dihydrodipicolinate synthase [Gloeobacter violaceus PCC 7421]